MFLDNILVEEKSDGNFECAICDFGLTMVVGNTEHGKKIVKGLDPSQAAGFTLRYAAPEVCRKDKSNNHNIIE